MMDKVKLEERLNDMFRNHNMNSAIQAMVNNEVCRNLLREWFDEYDKDNPKD